MMEKTKGGRSMWALFHKRQITSSQIILFVFALVILLGALALTLPAASSSGISTGLLLLLACC